MDKLLEYIDELEKDLYFRPSFNMDKHTVKSIIDELVYHAKVVRSEND